MLLERLRSAVGLTDSDFDWVRSFLTRQKEPDCLYTVFCADGTVWGSTRIRTGPAVVRSVHTAELAPVVDRHGLSLHQ